MLRSPRRPCWPPALIVLGAPPACGSATAGPSTERADRR